MSWLSVAPLSVALRVASAVCGVTRQRAEMSAVVVEVCVISTAAFSQNGPAKARMHCFSIPNFLCNCLQGVQDYEPRVVHQLLNLMYRYASDILQDADVSLLGTL